MLSDSTLPCSSKTVKNSKIGCFLKINFIAIGARALATIDRTLLIAPKPRILLIAMMMMLSGAKVSTFAHTDSQ